VAVGSIRFESDILRLLGNLGQLPQLAVEPFFIAVSGLPGTGKSHLCRELVKFLPALLIESDAVRKMLFNSPTYSFEESRHLFRLIHKLIEKLLSKGISVILDATNLTERNREYLYDIADRLKAKLILVKVTAPSALARQRLMKRQIDILNQSDADVAVYEKMLPAVEEIQRKHITVNTARDISSAIQKITREALGGVKKQEIKE
jgi:hypothetical protein